MMHQCVGYSTCLCALNELRHGGQVDDLTIQFQRM
jgi:hypothetical protein